MRDLQADLDALKKFSDDRMVYGVTIEWLERAIKAEEQVAVLKEGLEKIKVTIEEYHPHNTLTFPRFGFAKELHNIAIQALKELEVQP